MNDPIDVAKDRNMRSILFKDKSDMEKLLEKAGETIAIW